MMGNDSLYSAKFYLNSIHMCVYIYKYICMYACIYIHIHISSKQILKDSFVAIRIVAVVTGVLAIEKM